MTEPLDLDALEALATMPGSWGHERLHVFRNALPALIAAARREAALREALEALRDWNRLLGDDNARLIRECDALREALEWIAGRSPQRPIRTIDAMATRARAALDSQP